MRKPKPTAAPAPIKRRRGRPHGTAYKPTQAERELVLLAAGLGIQEDRIVRAIRNPHSKDPIDPKTLRKHFREELDKGMVDADMKAGGNLLALTKDSAAAAIFWAKCRLGMRERVEVELPPTESEKENADMRDLGRRIAFTLAMGGGQKAKTPA